MSLTLTEIVDKTTPTMRFIFGWSGLTGARVLEYHFSDGMVLFPKARSPFVPEWSYLIRGCTDPTGAKWIPYMELVRQTWESGRKRRNYKPGRTLNWRELTGPFTCRAHSPHLDKITYYNGPLNTDPNNWPELYREAYFLGPQH